ncbi:MAG: hypothetical protein ACO3QA_07125 [Phycisphaerales bacterium]
MTTTTPAADTTTRRGSNHLPSARRGDLGRLRALNAAAVASVALLSASIAEAGVSAAITWQTAQTITGDSDVQTAGTLAYAYTFGSSAVSATTVNGVNFAAFGISPTQSPVTVGNLTLSESPGYLNPATGLGASGTPYTSLSAGYQSLLGEGASASDPFTITVTLDGLTAGRQYSLQWWSSNSSGTTASYGADLSSTTAYDAFSNQVTLSSTAGGIGQYVVGTFTATGSIEFFNLESPSGFTAPLMNALQLRDITPTGVPGGAGLAGLLALGGVGRHRRRRR